MSTDIIDIAIIGAGPAGMAAAVEARKLGLSVCLLDEQAQLGGQIYRAIERLDSMIERILGADYAKGAKLAAKYRESGAMHLAGASVWDVSADGAVNYLQDGKVKALQARFVIVANGAMERPFPIPGWTLPGVMGGEPRRSCSRPAAPCRRRAWCSRAVVRCSTCWRHNISALA